MLLSDLLGGLQCSVDTIKITMLLSDLLGGLLCWVDTIRSRRKETGDSYRHHLATDHLVRLIDETVHSRENGRAIGHRPIQAALAQREVCIPRAAILSAMHQQDPDAVAARRERTLPRRTYGVQQAMILWHTDSKGQRAPRSSSCASLAVMPATAAV
ncbi:TPA: hypothetical protein ACH3X2_001085 [Trebouxia sp. C0005]